MDYPKEVFKMLIREAMKSDQPESATAAAAIAQAIQLERIADSLEQLAETSGNLFELQYIKL